MLEKLHCKVFSWKTTKWVELIAPVPLCVSKIQSTLSDKNTTTTWSTAFGFSGNVVAYAFNCAARAWAVSISHVKGNQYNARVYLQLQSLSFVLSHYARQVLVKCVLLL